MESITELLKHKQDINNKIIKKVNVDTTVLISLADSMAEAATNMHGQGYTGFIQARDLFMKTIHDMNTDYKEMGKYLS
jgi:hypothetical protein